MNLVFHRFNKLIAITPTGVGGRWVFLCDCGKTVERIMCKLVKHHNGGINGCGCSHFSKKHGDSKTRMYGIWLKVRERCYKKNCSDYPNYGARGISLHRDWFDYQSFKDWAVNNGYDEKLTLERNDVNGNYCPENCCWIPNEMQGRNRTNTHWFEMNGVKGDIRFWSEYSGIPYYVIRSRLINYKWSIERATSEPVRK